MRQPAWYERFGRLGRKLSLWERHYERALYYYEKGKYDMAIADLDEAILLAPKNGELYAARGLALLGENRPAEAEDDFSTALALDPTQWLAYYGRGMQAYEEGDDRRAIDAFSRAQRLAPQRPEIYCWRAMALQRSGQRDEALEDLKLAHTLFPADDKRRKQVARWLAALETASPTPTEEPAAQDNLPHQK